MKWFARLAAAGTLSAVAVAALTWADWPRPLFVVPLPPMDDSTLVLSGSHLRLDASYLPVGNRQSPVRTPWVGFKISGYDASRNNFWWVNLQDGRTAGPCPLLGHSHTWDYRGALIIGGASPAAFRPASAIGRLDPETGRYAVICDDRHPDFVISGNGETLLTFTPAVPESLANTGKPPGDADMVCFDLTADPPTRTRIDLTIREGQPLNQSLLHHVMNAVGGLALSPDGRTLAVAETWRLGGSRVTPRGVRLFDTRTGRAKQTLTDYGPPLEDAPPGRDTGAYGLVFSPDSRFLRLNWVPSQEHDAPPVHSEYAQRRLDPAGPQRLLDTETGAYVPPPHPGYTPDRESLPGPSDSIRGVPDKHAIARLFGGQFVPGTTGLVWVNTTPAPPPSRLDGLFRRLLRLPPPGPGAEVVWHDWAADELRVVRHFLDTRPGYDSVRVYVQEGRLGILSHRFSGGRGVRRDLGRPSPAPAVALERPRRRRARRAGHGCRRAVAAASGGRASPRTRASVRRLFAAAVRPGTARRRRARASSRGPASARPRS